MWKENKLPLVGIGSASRLLSRFGPCETWDEPTLLSGIHPSKVDKSLDEFGEALVAQCATNNGLSFWDIVILPEWGRVAVGISNEGECGSDIVRLSVGHELLAADGNLLVGREVRGAIEQSQEDPT